MESLPHNVAPLADTPRITTDALPSLPAPPGDISMADEDGDEILPSNATKANNTTPPSPVPGGIEESSMETPSNPNTSALSTELGVPLPNSFDGAALSSRDHPGNDIVSSRDGSNALNDAPRYSSFVANKRTNPPYIHPVDDGPHRMDVPMSIGSAEPGVPLPDPLNASSNPSSHLGNRSDIVNQNEPQRSNRTTESDMHSGDAHMVNANSDAGTSGDQGISPSSQRPTASDRPRRSLKLILPKYPRGSKTPREDGSGTGGGSTSEVVMPPQKRVAVAGPTRYNYESLKSNYDALLRRSKVQSDIGLRLERERDQLLAEQEAKINECKLVYEKETTNLRNEFKVEIERVKAQSTETQTQTSEQDMERESLRKEVEILRTETRHMNESFTQRLNSGVVAGVAAVKAALEDKNNKLMDDLAEMRSHNETLEQTIQELGAAVSKEDQLVRAEVEGLRQERDNLVMAASAMDEKYHDLKSQNDNLTAQISDIRLQFQSEVEKRESAILDLRRRLSTAHPASTQIPSNDSARRATGSADGFTNTPPQGSTTSSSHGFSHSNGIPIGIVPLQPVSSETRPPQTESSAGSNGMNTPQGFAFDVNNMEAMGAMMKEALRQMGYSEANVTKTRKRATRTPKSQVVKAQKDCMSQEADNLWKAIIRETWRDVYGVSTAADFSTYKPASEDEVRDCEVEISTPRDTWTLDFNKGWDRSRWNRLILRKVYERVLLRSRENGWNVPNVSEEYLMTELYGQVKRAREAWSMVQPRYQPSTGNLETPEEIMKRVEEANAQRLGSVGSRSRRERKFTRRSEIIEKVIAIKLDPTAPDLKTWEYFREMLKMLGPEGMSSEEEGVENIGNVKVSVFRVKLCTWRAPQIGEYFKYIDKAGDLPSIRGTRGTRALPRIPIEDTGTLPAPPGLPRKMYKHEWLDANETSRPGWVVDELRISREAFELLTFATR